MHAFQEVGFSRGPYLTIQISHDDETSHPRVMAPAESFPSVSVSIACLCRMFCRVCPDVWFGKTPCNPNPRLPQRNGEKNTHLVGIVSDGVCSDLVAETAGEPCRSSSGREHGQLSCFHTHWICKKRHLDEVAVSICVLSSEESQF